MASRRSRGDGGLHWDAMRERWIASVTVGYSPSGKRIVRRGSGRTKTEAKAKLKEILRDHDDGLASTPHAYSVAHAVNDWLAYGLSGRDASTVETRRILAEQHVIPALGARKLRISRRRTSTAGSPRRRRRSAHEPCVTSDRSSVGRSLVPRLATR